jgi:hypothetical protein
MYYSHLPIAAPTTTSGALAVQADGAALPSFQSYPLPCPSHAHASSVPDADVLSNREVVFQRRWEGTATVNRVAVSLGLRLLDIELGWEQVVRSLIVETGINNQGLVSEKVAARDRKAPLLYNELKFASQSEIRIAQELERRQVLFFPLAVAVRYDTGIFYKDNREVDFLVCQDGVWGILEVSYHPDRYEKDAEKTQWFKDAGVLCVEHNSSERCYNNPSEVVDKFLSTLSKYKR